MKFAKLQSILLLLMASTSIGQTAEPPTADEVIVVKYEWAKERIAWEKDPLSVPNESYNEMRERVRTERRQRTALEERSVKDARAEQKKATKPPRYVFRYQVLVQNNTQKEIREIDWDYVFTDENSGELLGTREFTSVEKIGPGKKKQLSILASSPPTLTISVHSLGSDERAGLAEKAVIVRVLFEDGTVLTRGN
jgi:hypothetical protein